MNTDRSLQLVDPKDKPNIDLVDHLLNQAIELDVISKDEKRRKRFERQVEKRIYKKSKFLVDQLFELSQGVYYVDKISADGEAVKAYKTLPDYRAITYLIDRMIGRPKERLDIKEEKKGLIVIENIIKDLAQKDNERTIINSEPDHGELAPIDKVAGEKNQ